MLTVTLISGFDLVFFTFFLKQSKNGERCITMVRAIPPLSLIVGQSPKAGDPLAIVPSLSC
jgi:hypothetical protein